MGKNRTLDISVRNERYKLLPNERCKIIRTVRDTTVPPELWEKPTFEEVSRTSIDSFEFFILETIEQSIKKGEEGANLILPIQKLGMNIDCWNDSGDPGKLFFKMDGGFPSSNLSVKNREEIYPLISTNDSEICYAEVGQLNDAEILFELIAPKLTWPLASVKKHNVGSRILIIDGDIRSHRIGFETTIITNLKKKLNAVKILIFVEMIDWEKNTTLVKFGTSLTRNLNFKELISNLRNGHEVVAYRLKNIKIIDEHCAVDLDIKVNLDDFKSWNILQTSSHDLVLSVELGRSKSNLNLKELVSYNEIDGPKYAYFNSEGELGIEDFPNILEISNSNFIENCRIFQGYKDTQYEISEEKIKRIPDNKKLKLKFDLTDTFRELVENNIFENIKQAMDAMSGYVIDYDHRYQKRRLINMEKTDERVFVIIEINDPWTEDRDRLLVCEWGGKTESGTTWQMMVGGKSRMTLLLRCGDIINEFNRKKIEESVQLICIRMKDNWGTWGTDDGMKSVYYLICRGLERFGRDSTIRQYYLEIDGQNKRKMEYGNIKIFDNGETEKVLNVELSQGIINQKNIEVLDILGRVVTPNGSMNERKIFWRGGKSVLEDIKMISNDQDLIDLGIEKLSNLRCGSQSTTSSKEKVVKPVVTKKLRNTKRFSAVPLPSPLSKGLHNQSDRAAALIKQSKERAMTSSPPTSITPPKVTGSVKKKPKGRKKNEEIHTRQTKENKIKRIHQSLKKQLNSCERNKPKKHIRLAKERLERFEKENKEILDI